MKDPKIIETRTALPPRETPDWYDDWNTWYYRRDVEEAREKARRYLANPNTDDDERT